MKTSPRILLVFTLSAVMLLLLGCGVNAQTKAIADAVVAYSDYYIEVRNLGDQVRAQAENANDSMEYIISVDIPDYAQIDPAAVGFILPEPDVATRSAHAYQRQSMLVLRQAMEQYVMQHGASAYLSLPVTFSLNSSGGWSANMTSQSKLDIQETVESQILSILQRDSAYSANDRLMQAASALPTLLTDSFGGKEYAEMLAVSSITANADDSFTATFTFPDAQSVYGVLSLAYVNSFTQAFYGSERAAQLTTEGLAELDISAATPQEATVTLTFDETAQAFVLSNDGGLGEQLLAARQQAQNEASAAVNARWRVQPFDPPANASVLEGESNGNQIVFKTGTAYGKYFYVRFYAISGEDTKEAGTLQLGAFVIGGKSAKLKLPTGYYRVTCETGDSWYGLAHLFGSDKKTYNGGNAIQSREGYINTISFE